GGGDQPVAGVECGRSGAGRGGDGGPVRGAVVPVLSGLPVRGPTRQATEAVVAVAVRPGAGHAGGLFGGGQVVQVVPVRRGQGYAAVRPRRLIADRAAERVVGVGPARVAGPEIDGLHLAGGVVGGVRGGRRERVHSGRYAAGVVVPERRRPGGVLLGGQVA